jgi:TRAP-type mannitol/chloroaromatic compound transport system permease small subunit/TRAP-type C4-dicarboxylate transport system substrate-binding protein
MISPRAFLLGVCVAFLTGLLAAVALRPAGPTGAGATGAPDGAGPGLRWRVPVAFGTNLPALGDNILAVRAYVERASGGRFALEVHEPGAIVPAFSITEAVADGKVPAGYTWLGYDQGRIPAAPLFSAVPFGLEPWEFMAWWYEGEGRALAEDLYGRRGVRPILCGLIGPETAGWFRFGIEELDDLRGLRIRFAGLGGRVLEELGASVTMIPGGEIFQALEKGAIDATEYSLPVVDRRLGFDRVARFNYFPGWHQTFTAAHLGREPRRLGTAPGRGSGPGRGRLRRRRHAQPGPVRIPAGPGRPGLRRRRHRGPAPARSPAPGARAHGGPGARGRGGARRGLPPHPRLADRVPGGLRPLEAPGLPAPGLRPADRGRGPGGRRSRAGTGGRPRTHRTGDGGRKGLPVSGTGPAVTRPGPAPDPGPPGGDTPRGPAPWPHTPASRAIASLVSAVGRLVSWVWLALLVLVVVNVVLRYAFGEGRVALEELQWHLYAIGFLLALAWCVADDVHIRVDLVHERLRPRHRAWIECYGIVLLLLPFCVLMLVASGPFVAAAWRTGEVSMAPGGLPLRWAIKAVLPLAFALLALSGVGRLLQAWHVITRVDPARARPAAPDGTAP